MEKIAVKSDGNASQEKSDEPLKPSPSPTHDNNIPPRTQRLLRRLAAPVRANAYAEVELVILTICTGIQDAATFPDYHCFASNQTGNTIFLTLVVVQSSLPAKLFVTSNIAVALSMFLVGGWITGQLGHVIGPRKRLWLITCNFIQTCLVFSAAAVQFKLGVSETGPSALTVLALMAFSAGSQVVQSRSLALTEISTAMATAAWVDLLIDSKLLMVHNRPRNRRISFLFGLAIGGFIGAWIYSRAGSAMAILVSGLGKLLVTVMYFFNEMDMADPQVTERSRLAIEV